jgi:hypothetical protein
MALTQKLARDDNDYKIDFNDTYYKIDTFFFDVINDDCKIGVRGYPNVYGRQNNGIGIFKKLYDIKFSDLKIDKFDKNSVLTAAYEYLKTLDDFKTAKDC